MTEDELVKAVTKEFRVFGGGRTSEFNPLANALRDHEPTFAAGVDVRAVVRFVLINRGIDHE